MPSHTLLPLENDFFSFLLFEKDEKQQQQKIRLCSFVLQILFMYMQQEISTSVNMKGVKISIPEIQTQFPTSLQFQVLLGKICSL